MSDIQYRGLEKYGFKDDYGHKLETCVDFIQLAEDAMSWRQLQQITARLNPPKEGGGAPVFVFS